MTQKKINDILYVFEDTAYEITKDTDATVIYVQEELVDDYISVNESLAAKIKPYNYKIAVVHELEWMPYINSGLEDPELAWSANSYTATIGEANTFPTLSNPHDVDIVYSSSDEEVATIDAETGEITLVDDGTTTIKAYFEGDDEYESSEVTYSLIVMDANPELSWSANNYEAIIGETNEFPTLTNPHSVDVEYSSSNEEVATIDSETGEITLVGAAGNLQINATCTSQGYSPQVATYVLNVREDAELSWSAASATVDLQDPSATYPTLSNPHSATLGYSTSDSTIATIDWMTGQVTPLQTGTVEIWAFAFNDPIYSGGAKYDLTITDTPQPVIYDNDKIFSEVEVIIENEQGQQTTIAQYGQGHYDNAVEGELYKTDIDTEHYGLYNLSTGEEIITEDPSDYRIWFTKPESDVVIMNGYTGSLSRITFVDDTADGISGNVFYVWGDWFEIADGETRYITPTAVVNIDQREGAPAEGKVITVTPTPDDFSATGGALNGAHWSYIAVDYTVTISDPVSEP